MTALPVAPETTLAALPVWLTVIATTSLLLAIGCALVVLVDVIRHPQPMAIMNVVWPLTMLFGSVLWLRLYRTHQRRTRQDDV